MQSHVILPDLISDTEHEILRLLSVGDGPTAGLYAMMRYHLGLDGSGSSGKRMRPLLGLLAYSSIRGDYHAALPGAAAVELGHNFSLVHDDIEDADRERHHRPTLWAVHGIPQAINAGDMLFTLSRVALHRLSELGFSDAKVLRLMRLYDMTCLALCEGQYLDIWACERSEPMSVELYFDMIGRKTAALIAAVLRPDHVEVELHGHRSERSHARCRGTDPRTAPGTSCRRGASAARLGVGEAELGEAVQGDATEGEEHVTGVDRLRDAVDRPQGRAVVAFAIGVLDVVVDQAEVVAELHGRRSGQRGVVVAPYRGVGEQPEKGPHPLSGRAAAIQTEVVAHHRVQAGRGAVAHGKQAQDLVLGVGNQVWQNDVALHWRIIATWFQDPRRRVARNAARPSDGPVERPRRARPRAA